ncbi:hypothetical protein TNCV_3424101 [Trichonephila clavipes]|nr:hypothetical protein TNCV_3424101 [Trichonephila clavipes]
MVAERLTRHHTRVTTVDELWHRVEAAWGPEPGHAIQSLLDSMPKRISAIITARGSCSGIALSSSWRVCGGGWRPATRLPRESQTCSIGFMSGEHVGHSIHTIPSSKRNSPLG